MKSISMILASIVVVAAAGTLGAGMVRVVQSDPPYDSRYERSQTHDSRGGNSGWGTLPANTPVDVRLDSRISTENVHPGDSWTGLVSGNVMSHRRVVIPDGTPVRGVVTIAMQGTHESQAQLGLAVRQVYLNGNRRDLNADTEPIVAGSHRAGKLGAIAGGAVVGGLLGHEISHEHGGLIGSLLGGAVGYKATQHAFRTLQLQPGTLVTFTTSQELTAERYRPRGRFGS